MNPNPRFSPLHLLAAPQHELPSPSPWCARLSIPPPCSVYDWWETRLVASLLAQATPATGVVVPAAGDNPVQSPPLGAIPPKYAVHSPGSNVGSGSRSSSTVAATSQSPLSSVCRYPGLMKSKMA